MKELFYIVEFLLGSTLARFESPAYDTAPSCVECECGGEMPNVGGIFHSAVIAKNGWNQASFLNLSNPENDMGPCPFMGGA